MTDILVEHYLSGPLISHTRTVYGILLDNDHNGQLLP